MIRYLADRTIGRSTYHGAHEGGLYLVGFSAQACPAVFQVELLRPTPLYGYDVNRVAHVVAGTLDGMSFRCGAAGSSIVIYSLALGGPPCPGCESPTSAR